ncbi:MAG: alpha/beta fold hydrolase [Planctomycetota bacterium]|nr:alpha/beta fold hydrolase [Planctomycetota bacterium]
MRTLTARVLVLAAAWGLVMAAAAPAAARTEPAPAPAEAPGGPGGPGAPGAPTTVERALERAASAADSVAQWADAYVSEEALDALAADISAMITGRLQSELERSRARYELTLGLFSCQANGSPQWDRVAAPVELPRRVVLLVHGLDEGGQIWDDAAPLLSAAGHTPIRFNYPNDQPITCSADRLAEALGLLKSSGVERVDIVAHSMGGLLARDVLTREAYYAGDARGNERLPAVTRLIMLGTPHRGAPLAPLRGVMELRDQAVRLLTAETIDMASLLTFAVDGMGEAGGDLGAGSAFLSELSARPGPRHVEMTNIVAVLAAEERDAVVGFLSSERVRGLLGPERTEALSRGATEVFTLIGDGAVPADSSVLAGADTVVVEANHRSMIKSVEMPGVVRRLLGTERRKPPAVPVILSKLGPAEKVETGGGR